jgi:hypothetical protein
MRSYVQAVIWGTAAMFMVHFKVWELLALFTFMILGFISGEIAASRTK